MTTTTTTATTPNPAAGETMRRHQAPPARLHRRCAVVCDVEGCLLRSSSCFPYFMVVALEGGGLLRAILLLVLHPLLSFLSEETSIRAMTLICFCGVSVSNFRGGAAVLPKHLLGDVGREGFQLLMAGERKVCLSRMPKVMVEEFLRKYLGVEVVVAREMKVAGGYYTGFMEDKMAEEEDALLEKDEIDREPLGFTAEGKAPLHPLFSRCQEVVAVSEEEKAAWRPLPKEEYPEALVFHDGRVAFRPTPLAATAMFMWLPFGCLLAFIRAAICIFLPYGVSTTALAFTGMKNRLVPSPFTPSPAPRQPTKPTAPPGRLFVCNHRTLLDPICISVVLRGPVTAVVYGVSALSQMLSPIRTVMLKRIREEDKAMIAAELRRGDVVICPEGTTCREPFLLRFSPLFAELADEVHPVALNSDASMFYGTTAGGAKFMDPFFVLMNPYTLYTGEFLESVPAGERRSGRDTANRVQEVIAAALGFRRTMLTRKDKYITLAGNDGVTHKRT
ncbi:unnamed protein product [Spirodela intermedia]|uniref:Phospholipid/glycerol acyltransferase domain-containing protein n=1 Tax=Spirodela intermedia TaxID=51605 RepID=A0A7I8KLC1_SPIIN|nr:unnamed protein product [Spirodela intermedia]